MRRTAVPDHQAPVHAGSTAETAGLRLRIWAKMLGMPPEEYRRRISELPRPTTTAELNEASLSRYGRYFASLLQDDEELLGIPAFEVTRNIPRPPAELIYGEYRLPVIGRMYESHKYNDSVRYRFKLAGHGGTWMGGDWDSDAGKFAVGVGGWAVRPRLIANYLVFTSRRVLITSGVCISVRRPGTFVPPALRMQYRPGEITIRPGWPGTAKGHIHRVDLAFPDDSWIGVEGTGLGDCTVSTGKTPGLMYRDLIAELLGFPVPPRTAKTGRHKRGD
jgi:hypothetical protein